jgi:hypothetical protein
VRSADQLGHRLYGVVDAGGPDGPCRHSSRGRVAAATLIATGQARLTDRPANLRDGQKVPGRADLPGEDVVPDAEDVLRVHALLEGADGVPALR